MDKTQSLPTFQSFEEDHRTGGAAKDCKLGMPTVGELFSQTPISPLQLALSVKLKAIASLHLKEDVVILCSSDAPDAAFASSWRPNRWLNAEVADC